MTDKLQKLDLSLENFKIIELFDILFKQRTNSYDYEKRKEKLSLFYYNTLFPFSMALIVKHQLLRNYKYAHLLHFLLTTV